MNFKRGLLGFCCVLTAATTPVVALADCVSRLVPVAEGLQRCVDDPRATWSAGLAFGSNSALQLSVTEYSGELRAIQTRGFNPDRELIDDCAVVVDSVGSGFDQCTEVIGFHETTMVP